MAWRPERGDSEKSLAAMSALALEELSAIAAIYCGRGECEVLEVSGDCIEEKRTRGSPKTRLTIGASQILWLVIFLSRHLQHGMGILGGIQLG